MTLRARSTFYSSPSTTPPRPLLLPVHYSSPSTIEKFVFLSTKRQQTAMKLQLDVVFRCRLWVPPLLWIKLKFSRIKRQQTAMKLRLAVE